MSAMVHVCTLQLLSSTCGSLDHLVRRQPHRRPRRHCHRLRCVCPGAGWCLLDPTLPGVTARHSSEASWRMCAPSRRSPREPATGSGARQPPACADGPALRQAVSPPPPALSPPPLVRAPCLAWLYGAGAGVHGRPQLHTGSPGCCRRRPLCRQARHRLQWLRRRRRCAQPAPPAAAASTLPAAAASTLRAGGRCTDMLHHVQLPASRLRT